MKTNIEVEKGNGHVIYKATLTLDTPEEYLDFMLNKIHRLQQMFIYENYKKGSHDEKYL